MPKRFFASLTTQEALCVAISIEARNARLYSQYAELFCSFPHPDSHEIAGVFLKMADEEYSHEAELKARYADRFGDADCEITAEDITDMIELPRFADGNIFAIARSGSAAVPASQALTIAFAAEEGAFRFYRRLAETCEDPEFAAFYAELARFESEHVEQMRFRLNVVQAITTAPEQA